MSLLEHIFYILANGIDARHKEELKYDVYCIS